MEDEEDVLEMEIHFVDEPTRGNVVGGGTAEETLECSEWIGRGLKLFNEAAFECLRAAPVGAVATSLDTKELVQLIQTHWLRLKHGLPMNWYERSLFSEIRHIRNAWAHQAHFNVNDAYRALDTLERAVAHLHAYDQFCRLRDVKRRLIPQLYRYMKEPSTRDHLVSFGEWAPSRFARWPPERCLRT
jgi:hypothetical protein